MAIDTKIAFQWLKNLFLPYDIQKSILSTRLENPEMFAN